MNSSATLWTPQSQAKRQMRVSFDEANPQLHQLITPNIGSVLDVGSGVGRDALALSRTGRRVTAVEPSDTLRAVAIAADTERSVEWLKGALPRLDAVLPQGSIFDLTMCSAVLMFVTSKDLSAAILQLAGTLRPSGYLAVSVRNLLDTDPPGRAYHHSNAQLIAAAMKARLEPFSLQTAPDALGRPGVEWRNLVFKAAA